MPEITHPDDLSARFTAFIRQEGLFPREAPLLLAVSGGLDSVVLLDLVHRAGFHYEVAHTNFQLRGEESDRDERHVRLLASERGVTIHVRHFDTEAYAALHGKSIQEAARELRYAWFAELCRSRPPGVGGHSFRTVTAHHLDDNIETMLFHLFRGTGIAGLRGMLPDTPMALRPLLFAYRSELMAHAHAIGLAWVEDSSNAARDYDRNFLRLDVLPLLEQRFPGVRQVLADNLQRFREEEVLHDIASAAWRKRLLQPDPAGGLRIPVERLRHAPSRRTLLWQILRDFGFSPRQSGEALRLLDAETGRFIVSDTHRCLRDRSWLSITALDEPDLSVHLAWPGDTLVHTSSGTLALQRMPTPPDAGHDRGPQFACIDARAVRYPLVVRKWRPGDYMYPLGMRKKKKVARILIDAKIPRDRKDRVWVVESDKRILWLVGIRMDDRFKVMPSTTEVLTLR
ncbi:MAG: tRNA lysidine(34) synthetase TilS, partial [Chitinophagia bacterium]|nr:tRNA lysidine(34) synthetase TilS [Chitinophagia bacterium]